MISRLFKVGKAFNAYPIRIIWVPIDVFHSKHFIKFTQSIPKRKFAKASKRNRIRRQVREAFRLNKHLINEQLADQQSEQAFAMMFLYIANEELAYRKIDKAVKKGIRRFLREI